MAPNLVRFGIQGGPGSFNESAFRRYARSRQSQTFEPAYLDTTPCVFAALEAGEIDLGQFALFNTYGGFYDESLRAVGAFRFDVVAVHSMAIEHVLMKRRDVAPEEITGIISHPEVFKQCKRTLATRFGALELCEGVDELADPARAAQALANGGIDRCLAVISNALIAEYHDLEIAADGLHDADSRSHFVVVRKFSETK